MKDLSEPYFRSIRVDGQPDDKVYGAFYLKMTTGNATKLRVIAAVHGDFDHVSVSHRLRCPTWDEMEYVARKFFEPWETAYQLHVPIRQHININPNVLHWWRWHKGDPGMPPEHYV